MLSSYETIPFVKRWPRQLSKLFRNVLYLNSLEMSYSRESRFRCWVPDLMFGEGLVKLSATGRSVLRKLDKPLAKHTISQRLKRRRHMHLRTAPRMVRGGFASSFCFYVRTRH